MQGGEELSAGAGHQDDPDSHLDHCPCDIAVGEADIPADADLPPATGGLHLASVHADDEDQVDGCDIDFLAHAATGDEDLPSATGGCA